MRPIGLIASCAIGVLVVLSSARASAIEYFCNPVDLCTLVPKTGGVPDYFHADNSKPWVIGKSDLVQLAHQEYSAGVLTTLGIPVVFVVEQGTLAVDDLGAGEAGLGAAILLCDQATFRIKNSTFRSLAEFPFQYPLYALGQSHVEMQDATIRTLRSSIESVGYKGAFFQVMGYQSTLTAGPGAAFGVRLPNTGDSWELAVVHDAQATVQSIDAFGEFYVAGNASFQVQDAQYHDMFFEVCPGDTFNIPSLPALCKIGDPTNGCITLGHPPVDYDVAPPQTPFHLKLVNDKVFAWAISTYEGSSIQVHEVPLDANFSVGLGGINQNLSMRLAPGNPPVMEGVTDRTLVFDNAQVSSWMVWPVGSSHIKLLPGSEVGDVLPSGTSVVEVLDSLLIGAMLDAPQGTEIHLHGSKVQERASNSGGKVWASATRVETDMPVAGPTWFADVEHVGKATMMAGGALHQVEIASPKEGDTLTPGGIPIRITAQAQDDKGVLSPFPELVVEVAAVDGGAPTQVVSRKQAASDEVVGTWDTTGWKGGDYEVRLFFAGEGAGAVSRRRVTLNAPIGDSGIPDTSVDSAHPDSPTSETGPVDSPTIEASLEGGSAAPDASPEDSGCGCRTPTQPSAGGLGWVILLCLGWARRKKYSVY